MLTAGARTFVSVAALLLIAAGAVAQDVPRARLPWWDRAEERQIGHYWIKTDLPAEEANELSVHLNLMYEQYLERLASLPQRVPERLNVMIFADRREYQEVLRTRFGVNATGTGGIFFVNSLGTALAFWTGDLPKRRVQHVLQHEGFHQFAWSRFGGDLPPWTNEGLAEFFGEATLVGRRLVIGQSTPRVLDSIKEAIELGTYVPFMKMLTMTPEQWRAALHDGTAALQYHQAWSMVHFLVYGDGGQYVGAFESYLRLLNGAVSSEEAFIRSFGNDVEAFEARWKVHALAAKPSAFVSALERIEFLAEGALELSRHGLVPGSLEELRAQLASIEFTQELSRHGIRAVLRAEDDGLYRIPIDDLAREQPVIVVEKPKLTSRSGRHRRFEEEHPTPPAISTRHLRPREIEVRWKRDRKTGVVSYDVVVK